MQNTRTIAQLYAQKYTQLDNNCWTLENVEPDALVVLGSPENFTQTLRFLRCQPVSESFGSGILIPKLCELNFWLRSQTALLDTLHAHQTFWLCHKSSTPAERQWQAARYAEYPTLVDKLFSLFEYAPDKLRAWLECCLHTMHCLLTMLDRRRRILMLTLEDELKWNPPGVRNQARFTTPFCLGTEMLQTFLQDQVYLYQKERCRVTSSKLRKSLTDQQSLLLVAGLPPFLPAPAEEIEATFLRYWRLLQGRHAVLAKLASMLSTAWAADSRALTTPAHIERWLRENGADENNDTNARLCMTALFRRMLGEHFNIAYKNNGAMRCYIVVQRESQIAEYNAKATRDSSPARKAIKSKLLL